LTKPPNDLEENILEGVDPSAVDLGSLSEESAPEPEGGLRFPKPRRRRAGSRAAGALRTGFRPGGAESPSGLEEADKEPELAADFGSDLDPESLDSLDDPSERDASGDPPLQGSSGRERSGGKGRKGGAKDSASKKKAPRLKEGRGLFLSLLSGFLWLCLGAAVFGCAAILLAYVYFSQDLPSVDSIKNYRPKTVTFFYSDDGRVIGEFYKEKRLVVPLSRIPERVREAFLAVEDADFYSHQGVNLKSVLRAVYSNLTNDSLQGASTITQQLVRGLLLTPERTISRKIREMILAFRLETTLTKDQILEMYLNQIYLGLGTYGVEAASQAYFDKHVENLTTAEAALLAGITQSPERKNPFRRPEEARARQEHAISRMLHEGYITQEEAAQARAEVLNLRGVQPNPNLTEAPYFTEHVRRVLAEKYGEESLYNDGWKIYTTVNIEAQRAADQAVARGLREYARRRGFKGPIRSYGTEDEIRRALEAQDASLPPEGLYPERLYEAVIAAVGEDSLSVSVGSYRGVVDKKGLEWILPKGALGKQLKRGDVVWVRLAEPGEDSPALTGSRDEELRRIAGGEGGAEARSFVLEQKTDVQAALLSMDLADGAVKAMVGGRSFQESQFNRATQSQRQPGSSFKPIVYAAAMDHGFTPGSVMVDGPVVIDDIGSRRRWKPMNSDNKFLGPMPLYNALVASRNLISVKVLEVIGFQALDETAKSMGIKSELPDSLAVALGSHGVTMPEMLTAYSSFPNQGTRVEPRYITRIEDRDGNLVESFEPAFHQAIPPATACELTWMLRGVVAQGTGTSVKPLNRPVGGKTGTTNDYSDAWFVGFTPEYVTAVWLGTDELKPRGVGEVGGRAAGPVFLYYMQKVLEGVPVTEFQVPEGAEIVPGGAFGVCYKAGTVGTGYSEAQAAAVPEEDFLRWDMEETMVQESPEPVT
jgi:penicillin-binding protein 1A